MGLRLLASPVSGDRWPMNMPRSASDWDARYRGGERPPWDTGRVDAHLQAMVDGRSLAACPVLEIGCGTGTDALWLAARGFTVTAVDLSSTAIERARERAREAEASIDFAVGSFPPLTEPAWDLVYDCGCFHTLDAEERAAFAREVAARLRAGGSWLSIMGSTDGPPRDHGPPRVSALEVVSVVEPHFEILSLTSELYDADIPTPARAWIMLARVRAPSAPAG